MQQSSDLEHISHHTMLFDISLILKWVSVQVEVEEEEETVCCLCNLFINLQWVTPGVTPHKQ